MEELIKIFHIDWKLLIAQLVNFGIVLFVIWRFALKPLFKVLEKRSQEISQGLSDAKKMEENLRQSESEREKKILAAKKEAQEIVEQARARGLVSGQEIVEQAKGEVQEIIASAKSQIAEEKNKMLHEAKAEVSALVVASAAKLIEELADQKLDKEVVAASLTKVKN